MSAPTTTDEQTQSRTNPDLFTESNGDAATTLLEVCNGWAEKVNAFLEKEADSDLLRDVQRQTRISLEVTHEALSRYKLEEICLSYNGGKDCLVILIIYLAALSPKIKLSQTRTHHPLSLPSLPQTQYPLPSALPSIHIIPPHPFPEIITFVSQTSAIYHLSLTHSSLPMLPAFTSYLSSNPCIRAILVGTRRTDPHGHSLTHFDPTDGNWPRFMRIHPVIDWHYREIWAFIRSLGVDYCELYDRGYTSLGEVGNTKPNPGLAVEGNGFRPAYELVEDDAERLGRG